MGTSTSPTGSRTCSSSAASTRTPPRSRRCWARIPAIAQAAVVGVPDDRMGEVGHAFVVPTAGTSLEPPRSSPGRGRTWPTTRSPARCRSSTRLPLNASGKVLRYELRDRASAAANDREALTVKFCNAMIGADPGDWTRLASRGRGGGLRLGGGVGPRRVPVVPGIASTRTRPMACRSSPPMRTGPTSGWRSRRWLRSRPGCASSPTSTCCRCATRSSWPRRWEPLHT